jgi:hypothetical protein
MQSTHRRDDLKFWLSYSASKSRTNAYPIPNPKCNIEILGDENSKSKRPFAEDGRVSAGHQTAANRNSEDRDIAR